MKLCFICGEYPPGPQGGIGTVVQLAARKFVQAGHQVKVIGIYEDERYTGESFTDEGVEVYRIRQQGAGLVPFARACYQQYHTIKNWVERNEIELIEAPESRGWFAFWPALNAVCVLRAHGSETQEKLFMGKKPNRLTRYLEQKSYNRADACSAVSNYAANAARDVFSIKIPIEVIYNGIEFIEMPKGERQPHHIVFAGTLNEKKGIVNLIKACIELHNNKQQFTLTIAGKDTTYNGTSMIDYLKSIMREDMLSKVTFTGPITRGQLFDLYSTCAIGVFPSQWESFGLAPIEAMMCGCPVIHTTIPTGYELIDNNENGILVDPHNYHELAEKISLLLNDQALCEKLGTNGILKVKDNFTVEVMCNKLSAFYNNTIQAFRKDS